MVAEIKADTGKFGPVAGRAIDEMEYGFASHATGYDWRPSATHVMLDRLSMNSGLRPEGLSVNVENIQPKPSEIRRKSASEIA